MVDDAYAELSVKLERLEVTILNNEKEIVRLRDKYDDHQKEQGRTIMNWFNKTLWFLIGAVTGAIGALFFW